MSVDRKILHWLETEIFEGNIALGQDLPNDRRIAATIRSSHNSTREALKRLEAMGVLRLYEGKRKTIIPQLLEEPANSVAPALRLHMAQARHPVRDMIQVRIMIESWAVLHADCQHPSMQELADLLAGMKANGVIPSEFHQHEVNFHIALTKLSGNHLLTGLMTAMSDSIHEYLLSLLGKVPLWSATATRLLAEYQAIYDALSSGDKELARQLVVANIEQQYQDAGIDLDQETGAANEMPGALAAASLEPVDIDADDLVPDEWEESVSPEVISALEKITGHEVKSSGFTKSQRPGQSSLQEAEPAATSRQQQVGPEDQLAGQGEQEELRQQPRQPQGMQPPISLAQAQAQQAKKQPIPQSDRNTLRAPGLAPASSRRRRGTVSSPVHATVIKPINRSAGLKARDGSGQDQDLSPSETEERTYRRQANQSPDLAEHDQLSQQEEQASRGQPATGSNPPVSQPLTGWQGQSQQTQAAYSGQTDQGALPPEDRRNFLSKWLGFNRPEERAQSFDLEPVIIQAEKPLTDQDRLDYEFGTGQTHETAHSDQQELDYQQPAEQDSALAAQTQAQQQSQQAAIDKHEFARQQRLAALTAGAAPAGQGPSQQQTPWAAQADKDRPEKEAEGIRQEAEEEAPAQEQAAQATADQPLQEPEQPAQKAHSINKNIPKKKKKS